MKIAADIEYRVIGNFFGLLIASGGLLAGTMMSMRSLDYWLEDIVPLILVAFLAYRLMRNLLNTMIAYPGTVTPKRKPVSKENIQRIHAAVAQLPEAVNYTPEQVLEEVSRRIEIQKAEAAKKNR